MHLNVLGIRDDCAACAGVSGVAFSAVMPRDMWHVIKWNLAVVDSVEDAPAVDKEHPEYDRLWKMRPVLDAVLAGCMASVQMGRAVSLDEAMVKCKGTCDCCASCDFELQRPPCRCRFRFGFDVITARIAIKIRIPSKPIRDGIKMYVLACPETGCALDYRTCELSTMLTHSFWAGFRRYIYFFLAHDWVPADKKKVAYFTARPWVKNVSELVQYLAAKLPSSSYVIVTDSYFTSAKTFRALRASGFHAVGTLKGNSDVPKELLWRKHQKLDFGTSKFLRSTDRKLLVQEWKDSAVVRILSTFHKGVAGTADKLALDPSVQQVQRWRKDGLAYARSSVGCPPAVRFYQATMRGVDMADQVHVLFLHELGCLHELASFLAETRRVHVPAENTPVVHVTAVFRAGCLHCEWVYPVLYGYYAGITELRPCPSRPVEFQVRPGQRVVDGCAPNEECSARTTHPSSTATSTATVQGWQTAQQALARCSALAGLGQQGQVRVVHVFGQRAAHNTSCVQVL